MNINILQAEYRNSKEVFKNAIINALAFNGYAIGNVLDGEDSYFYIKNRKGEILQSKFKAGSSIPLISSEKEELTEDIPFLQDVEGLNPYFKNILKFFETGKLESILNKTNYSGASTVKMKVSPSEYPDVSIKTYDVDKNAKELNYDLEFKEDIENIIFIQFLMHFYQTINMDILFKTLYRNHDISYLQKYIKNEKELEEYKIRDRLKIPAGENERMFLFQLRKNRTEKERKSLNPDYITALTDAGNLIDKLINSEHEYTNRLNKQYDNEKLEEAEEAYFNRYNETSESKTKIPPVKISSNESMWIRQTYNNIPGNLLTFPTMPCKTVFDTQEKDFSGDKAKKKFKETIKQGRKNHKVETDMELIRTSNLPEIKEYLSVPIPENELIGQGLTPKTKRVHDAVATLVDNHVKLHPNEDYSKGCYIPITINQIYRAMGFKKTPKEKQKNEIIKAMYRLGENFIWIDNKTRYEVRGIDIESAVQTYGSAVLGVSGGRIAQRLVNANPVEKGILTCNGRKENLADGFILRELPPLYVDAKLTGIVTSIPSDLLYLDGDAKREKKDKIGNSEEIKAIKLEVMSRVMRSLYYKEQAQEKNLRGEPYNNKNYNTIVLDDLFKNAGVDIKSAKTRYKYIQITENIFKALKKEKNIIKGYEATHKGDVLHAIKYYV